MTNFPDSHRDLLEAAGAAILSTVGRDGYPQVTAVAYLLDDDGELRISLNTTRQKTKNLIARPRCTLFFIDPSDRYRTLEVRADVELAPDEDFAFAARAGAKYGTDFHNMDNPGETRIVVTLRPSKINSFGAARS